MGNLNCLSRDENIDNIIKRNHEINTDDFLILDENEDDNDNYNGNYNDSYNNNSISKYKLRQHELSNNENKKNNNENIRDKEQNYIYNMEDLNRSQILKLRELFEYFNKNGKARSSSDFNPYNWQKFYSNDEPFFNIKEMDIIHNQIKIYDHNKISKIKIYQGDLNKKGQRHGIGKLTTAHYVLIGMWKNDKFNGWGRESRRNGDIYEGKFINGIINGKGFFIDINKNKYIGDFINMKRWGKGKWVTNKIIYTGDFYNNKIHGKGKIKFLESGIEYIGTFKKDQIDGYGIFKWKNGDVYEGEVKNGKMHGKGKYKYHNGKIFNGKFSYGQISDKKEMIKTLKDKKGEKEKTFETFNYYNLYKNNNNVDQFIIDGKKTSLKKNNKIYFNINEENNKSLYDYNPRKNLTNKTNKTKNIINKNTFDYKIDDVKTNSFEILENDKEYLDINSNIKVIEQLDKIQEKPEYIDFNYNSELIPGVSEFNQIENNQEYLDTNENDLLNEIKLNEKMYDNVQNIEYTNSSTYHEKEKEKEKYNNKDNKDKDNNINNILNINQIDSINEDIDSIINNIINNDDINNNKNEKKKNEQKKDNINYDNYLETFIKNNEDKQSLWNNNNNKNNNINKNKNNNDLDNIKIEKDSNQTKEKIQVSDPYLLLSTYRNFGFGDEY